MQIELLYQQFAAGTVPESLDGFYRGELLCIIPGATMERIGSVLFHIWLPWKGKWFDEKKKCGDNIIPAIAARLILLRYGSGAVGEPGYGGFHALPFRTSIEKGIHESIDVLNLEYDLPENPALARTVVDELVQLKDGSFLGKAYVKEHREYRLVAFFRLQRPS